MMSKYYKTRFNRASAAILFFLAVLAVGCKKPYSPQVINSPKSYLVVEGVINTNDVTTIKVSRTVNLTSSVTTNPVEASLAIESDNGSTFGLNEIAAGVYQLAGVTLDNTRKFRLRITTTDNNKVYVSDYEQAKITPPIDSIGFIVEGTKLRLYANSHDPNNSTRYYRFDYAETWKFHSSYGSSYMSNGTEIVSRPADKQIYYCFANNASSTILLGSTAKLTQDLLYQLPLTSIESTSEKIELKYSILVHEYSLTADAYKFWGNLKKNTEQLGSIFDAEPSTINGNIHNTADPGEPVIGYISAGTVQTKRIFIDNEQLPDSWMPTYPYQCEADSFFFDHPKTHVNDVAVYLIPGVEIPISAIYAIGNPKPIGYTGSTSFCIDCTLRGSTQQPDFWK